MLQSYIEQRLKQKNLLLMTHIVLGYPSYDDSMRIVEAMVTAGVDLMELQIPFSEPMADGSVILRANAQAISAGATMEKSLAMAEKITAAFDIPFIFMTYYNILHRYGVKEFVSTMQQLNVRGAIIPDLPPEEGSDYLQAMAEHQLDPIHIFTPNSSLDRKRYLSQYSSGFMYTVARKGVTGKETQFSDELGDYLNTCREATDLPLALGFGVKSKADFEFIRGKADIAVIGSEAIRVVDRDGVEAIGPYIDSILAH